MALNRLSATTVAGRLAPGRHPDGGGLMLFVRPGGSRQSVLRRLPSIPCPTFGALDTEVHAA
jgi:hypothetical protein